jgi:hypothetical protein
MIGGNSDWKRSTLLSRRKREFASRILRTGITSISSLKKNILARLEEEGFISIHEGHLYPTQTGLAVADSLSQI